MNVDTPFICAHSDRACGRWVMTCNGCLEQLGTTRTGVADV